MKERILERLLGGRIMDEIVIEAKNKMSVTVSVFKQDLGTLRTGRANAMMLDRVECDYYGEKMPINQLASILVSDARQLVVKPYDRGDMKAILAGIASSDLGINPINDGDVIRINIPPLTEDSRRDLVKKGKAMLENAKVSVRNVRRDYLDFIKNSDDYADDYKKRMEADVQKVTDEAIKNLEEIFSSKEKEIMAI